MSENALELRFRGPGGALPRQLLGERAGAASQPGHEGRIGGEREHAVG